jgi:signal transduction histidine kinase
MMGHTDFDLARFAVLVQLAGPTSHDFRGALSTLALHLDLLETMLPSLPDGLGASIGRYLQIMQRERHQLVAVIDPLLALIAHQESAPAEVDVAALLQQTGAALQPLAKERRVQLAVPVSPLPVRLWVGREALRQRILDLLLGRLNDTPAGHRLAVDLTATRTGVRIRVHDPDTDAPGADFEVASAPESREG